MCVFLSLVKEPQLFHQQMNRYPLNLKYYLGLETLSTLRKCLKLKGLFSRTFSTCSTPDPPVPPKPASPGVLLTGGDSTRQSTELFPPVPDCTTPQLPAYRRYHSTFMTDNLVLASCGGWSSGVGVLTDCLTLEPVSMQWQSDTTVLGHLPGKRFEAADVTVAGVGTYLLGGWDRSYRLSSSAFLPSGSSTWQSEPSLPYKALDSACAFSYKTSFFVIGV